MFCKLLALKANDKDVDREDIVRNIYETVSSLKDEITDDQHLLIEQFVDFYKNIPRTSFEAIKKEVEMTTVASTITEHFQLLAKYEGELLGIKKGKREGKREGEINGEINMLDKLYQNKMINKMQYDSLIRPLKKKLLAIKISEY